MASTSPPPPPVLTHRKNSPGDLQRWICSALTSTTSCLLTHSGDLSVSVCSWAETMVTHQTFPSREGTLTSKGRLESQGEDDGAQPWCSEPLDSLHSSRGGGGWAGGQGGLVPFFFVLFLSNPALCLYSKITLELLTHMSTWLPAPWGEAGDVSASAHHSSEHAASTQQTVKNRKSFMRP